MKKVVNCCECSECLLGRKDKKWLKHVCPSEKAGENIRLACEIDANNADAPVVICAALVCAAFVSVN